MPLAPHRHITDKVHTVVLGNLLLKDFFPFLTMAFLDLRPA